MLDFAAKAQKGLIKKCPRQYSHSACKSRTDMAAKGMRFHLKKRTAHSGALR
jgi:hypothetical protein